MPRLPPLDGESIPVGFPPFGLTETPGAPTWLPWNNLDRWWPWKPDLTWSGKEKNYADLFNLWLLACRLGAKEVAHFVDKYILQLARDVDPKTDLYFSNFSKLWVAQMEGGQLNATLITALASSKEFNDEFNDFKHGERALRARLPRSAFWDVVGYLIVLGERCVNQGNEERTARKCVEDLLSKKITKNGYQGFVQRANEALQLFASACETSRDLDPVPRSEELAVVRFWELFKEYWIRLSELRAVLDLSINALSLLE